MMPAETMPEVFKGRIVALHGSWQSGLATMVIEDEDRGTRMIHCENTSTVRALEGAFGDVIGNSHSIKEDGGHVGKEIYYSVDFLNILEAFTPVDEADEELIAAYENTRSKLGVFPKM